MATGDDNLFSKYNQLSPRFGSDDSTIERRKQLSPTVRGEAGHLNGFHRVLSQVAGEYANDYRNGILYFAGRVGSLHAGRCALFARRGTILIK